MDCIMSRMGGIVLLPAARMHKLQQRKLFKGTSTARRAVVLLRAVARLAAMVLPALMPTNLKATLLRLSGPDRSHGSKLLRIGTVASYTMLLEFAIMVRSMGCVTFLWL
ncbi:hypothetical protein OIDMADRAFT_147005 [Oidiodendron maius Zn]|uniref:Uncharacterized protein n=1 Tax=Oidiodendron maius (strain Zn) TaxID=913774 RepID=A0A0C3CHJ7_OIDMZ|nr:hypothetical protein OIDMADRAFT_147005 [Oidiodendron maius Zn]